MHKVLMGILILMSTIHAQELNTTTSTQFGDRTFVEKDAHGKDLYNQDVTMKTEHYKIDTFWKRFHNPENKTNSVTQVTTKGTAQLSVDASSGCSIAGKGQLPEQGCSGQKPFLLNDEAISGLNNGDTVTLIFQPAYDEAKSVKTYNQTQNGVFYPLDIGRNGEYYKSTATVKAGSKKTFFSFFSDIFSFFISDSTFNFSSFFSFNTIADSKTSTASSNAVDRRQRYIANIVAGVDQDHLMSIPYKSASPTQISAPNKLNDPTSLLHYDEATKVTAVSSCGFICKIMRGFGFSAWWPFMTNAKVTTLDSDTITIDTENALLSAAGKVTGVSYQKVTATTDTAKLSLLDQMLKPMTAMMNMMKTIMFGSTTAAAIVADPVDVITDLSANPMTLTFAVTNNGSQVDRFETFKLTALRSTYDNSLSQCTVKKSWSWTDTFYANQRDTITSHTNGTINTHGEWVDWCQKQVGTAGIKDYLSTSSSGGFFSFFTSFFSFFSWGTSYEMTDYKNGLKRGLILDLKKDTLNPGNLLNTTTIKLINVKH